ncbi:hypothetical protein Sjap_001958 [Stephania japonica]|uniref:Uncharacterized protein n=1 Tax=Stephania japonica TaxID=461633 RepID=A0AAP0PS17_9MAGN
MHSLPRVALSLVEPRHTERSSQLGDATSPQNTAPPMTSCHIIRYSQLQTATWTSKFLIASTTRSASRCASVEAYDFCGESFHPTYACPYHPRYCLAIVQDMNLTEQKLDQWIEQRDQEAEEEIKSILQMISVKTMSAISLESVEVNEVTLIEDYWSKPEEIIKVSLHEPNISIAQNEADEAEKEIDVILESSEEPQKRS